MTDDDDSDEKKPYRAPVWLVPFGVFATALLAAMGIACLGPGVPFLNQMLGPGSYELTGWFLLVGAALTAYNLNLAQPAGILETAGWGLFGLMPLTLFWLLASITAFEGVMADPVNWHAALFAIPALLTLIVATQGDDPKEDSDYASEQRHKLNLGNPDPISVERDPRLEPVASADDDRAGPPDLILSPLKAIVRSALFIGVFFVSMSLFIALRETVFERRDITLERFVTGVGSYAPEFAERIWPYFVLFVVVMFVGDFMSALRRRRR